MMKKTLIAAALAAPLLASAATNILLNGSFESGFANWNIIGPGLYPPSIGTYGTPFAFGEVIPADTLFPIGSPDAVGTRALYFVDDTASQLVSQMFTLPAGTYTTGFDYYLPANGFANPNNAFLSASVVGATTVSSLTVALATGPATTWIHASNTFTIASAGNYTFNFVFSSLGQPAKDIVIDRAFIVAVPEPETYGLMMAGLLAVGYAVRRRSAANR
jgi:hypothetical protein